MTRPKRMRHKAEIAGSWARETYTLPLGYTLVMEQDPNLKIEGVVSVECLWDPHMPTAEDLPGLVDAYHRALADFGARHLTHLL